MSLEAGQVLEGKYKVVRRLAEGGMSTVFLAVNERIGKDVAVKVLHPVVALDEDVVERFEREARIGSRIKSDHIADVYDFGALPTGERFMVMEYLEGESLAEKLERERTVSPRVLATIADQVLSALVAAHNAGIVHRDLKPENIVILQRGKDITVKLVDFGISKVVGAGEGPVSTRWGQTLMRRTAANAVLGTPLYMSPEQARGNSAQVDQRTDLYALGVILYEATCGEPPILGENVNDLLFRVALDEPTPLATRMPSVDPALAAIVTRAMKKDLAERFQSAEEMRDAVEGWRAVYLSASLSPTQSAPAPRIEPVQTPFSLVLSTEPEREPLPSLASQLAEVPRPPSRFRQLKRASVALPFFALMLVFALSPSVRGKIWTREAAPVMAPATEVVKAPEPAIEPATKVELPVVAESATMATTTPKPVDSVKPAPRPARSARPAPHARKVVEDVDGGLPPPALDALPAPEATADVTPAATSEDGQWNTPQ